MTLRNPKKVGKGSSGTTKWVKMGQVGTSGSSGTGRSGSPDLRGSSGSRTRGSSIDKWVKNKGSFQLNLSTWPKVELPGRVVLSFSREYWVYFDITWKRSQNSNSEESWWNRETFSWSKFSLRPACVTKGLWFWNNSCLSILMLHTPLAEVITP